MKIITIHLKNEQAVLTGFLHDNGNGYTEANIRPAVLVFPGGGYSFCSDREGEPIALAYSAEGYNTFVLQYSVGPNEPTAKAFEDAQSAMAHLHEHAEEYRIDKAKIAVIGFSAGGHLAAWVSVFGDVRPNATILGYPCILQSMREVLGGKELPDLCAGVNKSTPPAFIFATCNDPLVPAANSLEYAAALGRQGVSYELHVFRDGAHGLSLAKAVTACEKKAMVRDDVAQWLPVSVRWLSQTLNCFIVP